MQAIYLKGKNFKPLQKRNKKTARLFYPCIAPFIRFWDKEKQDCKKKNQPQKKPSREKGEPKGVESLKSRNFSKHASLSFLEENGPMIDTFFAKNVSYGYSQQVSKETSSYKGIFLRLFTIVEKDGVRKRWLSSDAFNMRSRKGWNFGLVRWSGKRTERNEKASGGRVEGRIKVSRREGLYANE